MTCLFVLVIFMTGCASFPVAIHEDPFKGVTIVSVDMWHTVLDSDLDNIRTLYYKKISKSEVSDPIATIVFVGTVDPYYGYHCEGLSREGYIMVDSESFPVNLFENKKERMKHNSMYYNYPFFFAYPHFHPYFHFYYPGVVIVKESRRCILTAKISLTPDIQRALAGAVSYKIRMYQGEIPVTLEATSRQLEALKKFLMNGQSAGAPPEK